MNKKGNSSHRPYEVIETEETVTRYFDPCHSKVLANSTDSCRTNPQCRNGPNLYEQHDPKIGKNVDGQMQALYEKFTKLRTTMSELTKKFKEINSATRRHLPAFDDVHIAKITDFSLNSCQPENVDGGDLDSRDCASQVNEHSQSDYHQSPASNQGVGGDGEPNDSETEHSFNNISNQVDVPILNRSKKLLIRLIDKELQRLQSSRKTFSSEKSNPVPCGNPKQLKMECINRIAEELDVLKGLEQIE